MQVALVIDNEIKSIGEIKELFPNVSFPSATIDYEFMQENSLLEIVSWENFDVILENLETVPPYVKNGKVYTCLKTAKSEIELQTYYDSIRLAEKTKVRTQRNQLLKDSDWTQVADAPVDKIAWQTYRQELRDITSQEGFPFNVLFPNPPL